MTRGSKGLISGSGGAVSRRLSSAIFLSASCISASSLAARVSSWPVICLAMSESSTSRLDISRSTERCWAMPSFGPDFASGSFLRREGRSTTKRMVAAPMAYTAHCIVSVAASKRIIHDLVATILRQRCVFSILRAQSCLIPGPIVGDDAIAEGERLPLLDLQRLVKEEGG